ncbi:hypothetical protein V8E53_011382 [Lactarius tabidus]
MLLFEKEDSLEALGYSEICPNPFDLSESAPDPNSDDGTPLTVAPPTLHNPYLLQDVPSADWGATGTSTRLADNALGLVFPPFQMHADKASAVVTSTPQAESLRAPSNHQDIRSRERTNQKCRAPRGYTTPQSNVTANEALVAGFPQDTCLRGAMRNVSGSEMPEKVFTSSQKAHPYRRTSKPRKNYGLDDGPSSGEPKKSVDQNDALSTCAEYSEESYNKLLRAPLMRPIELPNDEV